MTSLVAVAVLAVLAVWARADSCYWNSECPYLLYSTKTPYDTVRGDIRDYDLPQNCEAISIWTLNRHGNRNPNKRVTKSIKYIASLKDEIITGHNVGRSKLCAQDIQNLREWTWNETLEVSPYFLTGTGYEELFNIGSRLREKYPHLLQGSKSDYYFRPTNEQRTTLSAIAFVHGLTEGTNLTLTPDTARKRDDIIRTYEHCDRYKKTVERSRLRKDQLEAYYNTEEFIAVRNAVQQRLGINTHLTSEDIYSIYEICRFDRSWAKSYRSPWCAAFSTHDLEVLEYKDDIRHYYKIGYGSSVNAILGGPALNDLYENFKDSVSGQGKKIVSYFTHDSMLMMVYCALGLYKDADLQGSYRDPNRLWRSSFIAAFSANFIAVLNRCNETGRETHRVQMYINEESKVCPLGGCPWEQFTDKFKEFESANLDICSMSTRTRSNNRTATLTVLLS